MTRLRTRVALVGLTAAAATLAAVALPGSASAAGSTTVWTVDPACAVAAAGHASCYALKLERTTVSSAQAAKMPAAARTRPAMQEGPAGGYTPFELAKAYGLSSDAATNQTVAIVDAFDDPTVLSDLSQFDATYGLPPETASSFKVVNQLGQAAPLPSANPGWAAEITLDVQAVRGLCHKCKILLVEANDNQNSNLAAAVNTAVNMGAKIVSNSYGGPQTEASDAAYDHPGVAILASSGDDGWYGWDRWNTGCPSSCGGAATDNAPSAPAVYNSVIAVGGTSLYLNPDGTRASESVWNENGQGDIWGYNLGGAIGAAGSGCSTLTPTQPWQQKVAGYGGVGCAKGKRSGVDIAAIADPYTGYDIFHTTSDCTSGCWQTFGGTSLSSPVVAAMWGLAGGPGGVANPALSLYGHFKSTANSTYDVTVGGTGFCGTGSPTWCTGGYNPNTGTRELDCAWDTAGTSDTPLANRSQCYARPGYDGVSGVGTPIGVKVFKAMRPTAVISTSGPVTHRVSHSYSAASSTDPFPGGSIVTYAWNWGDGHTSTGKTASHTYATKGAKKITLTVTDNYGRSGTKKLAIKVS